MVDTKSRAEYVSYVQDLDDVAPGWDMKHYERKDTELKCTNEVTLIALDKNETFDESESGNSAYVARQGCYVVSYTLNHAGAYQVFTVDDLDGAIDFTLKIISLIKA